MKRRTKLVLTALATILILAPFAYANSMHREKGSGGFGYSHHEMDGKGSCGKIFFHKAHFLLEHQDKLGLSDKQVEDIRNLVFEVKKNAIKQEADVEVLGLEIFRNLHQDKLDVDAINKLIDQKYDIKKAQAKAEIDSLAKLKSILSEEQHKKMKELFKARMEEREEGEESH